MNYQKYLWGFHVIEAMRTPPMWLGGKEDLGRRLQSDKSKGSYVAPSFGDFFPWKELAQLHVG